MVLNNIFVILGDCHLGAKNFNLDVWNNQKKFFENQLFTYMRANNIKQILQLGDFWDNRIVIDISFLNAVVDFFRSNSDIEWITMLGNHDIYYKNKRDINLSQLFTSLVSNVTVITEPTIIGKIGLQPWVLGDDLLDCEHLFGHFEIRDFYMSGNSADNHSELNTNILQKYKSVWSGHYHSLQQRSNITYVGTPYELTWAENDCKHGFFVKTDSINFIENTESRKHVKIVILNGDYLVTKSGETITYSKEVFISEIAKQLSNDIVKLTVLDEKDDIQIPAIKELLPNVNIVDTIQQDATEVPQLTTSQEFIFEFIQTNHKELLTEFNELFEEIQ